jgi:hypothetical protein
VVQQKERGIMLEKDLRFKGKTGIMLGKDIYLYKNFYENINEMEETLAGMAEEDWKTHGNYEAEDHSDSMWNDRLSLDFIDKRFHGSVINFVSPQYWIFSHGNFIRSRPTDESVIQEMSHFKNIPYLLAYYAGDFEGGEIVFSDLEITYSPQKNDLLIFKPTKMEILKVKSGVKYSYIDCVIEAPGYFMA